MRNEVLTNEQAERIASSAWVILNRDGGNEIILQSGCQLVRIDEESCLLKGYAWDGSDIEKEIGRLG